MSIMKIQKKTGRKGRKKSKMMIMIQGGSGSGKSKYAEQKACELMEDKGYYLATMQVYDEEGAEKVNRHKQQRIGKGFLTIEQPVNIEEAEERMEKNSVVLLECMSNLTANEMFQETKIEEASIVVSKIRNGIRKINNHVKHLVLVTNNVFEDDVRYDDTTMQYLKALGNVNEALAKEADEVIEVVVGIPIRQKAERSMES